MIPGRRSDFDPWALLPAETPSWVPPRPVLVVDTTACPRCQGSGEVQVRGRVEPDTGAPVLAYCTACGGAGTVSLEEASVCEGCSLAYWLEDGCSHDGHWCHDCAPSGCHDCQAAAADDAGYDPIRWGANH